MNICVSKLSYYISILLVCSSSPVSGFLLLFSCPDFLDLRQTSQQNQSEWLLGRSDETPDYQIIKPDFPILADCDATVSRYEYLSDEQNQTFVTKAGYHPKLYERRDPQRFTQNGDYFDGFHYFQRSEYCVNSITNSAIELQVCQPICNAFKTRFKKRYCVPKCCAPDEVLSYWSLRCMRYRQQDPIWKPVICEDESCSQAEPFHNIHFQRHSLSCFPTSIFRHPMTSVELIYKHIHQIDEKRNVRMDITKGHLELQRLSVARKWELYNVDFCVDGFVESKLSSYTGLVDKQVFLTCMDEEAVTEVDSSSHYTQGWISVSMQLMGGTLSLLTALIYLILLDRQNFNGLLIITYNIVSFLAQFSYAAAHYISLHPSPEITGIFSRGPVCMIIAISSHFFFFVGFSWLTVMNLNFWLTMRSINPVNARNSKRMKLFFAYSVLAWGIPAVVITSFAVVDEVYRDPTTSAVVPDYAMYSCTVASWSRGYYVYAPVAIFLLINGILTFLAVRVMMAAKRNAAQMAKTGADTYTVTLFLKLFILMGVIAFVNLFLWYFNGKEEPWPISVLKFIMQFESIPIFFIFSCNERITGQLEDKFPSLKGISRIIKALQPPSLQPCAFCINRSNQKANKARSGGNEMALQEI